MSMIWYERSEEFKGLSPGKTALVRGRPQSGRDVFDHTRILDSDIRYLVAMRMPYSWGPSSV